MPRAEVGPMDNPGPTPMGVVDASDFPMQLQHKGDGAPLPDQINFTIGAGVSPELAAQYGANAILNV